MGTYKAIVTRDNKWWMITVPELAGHIGPAGAVNVGDTTQARRLAEVPAQARDFICTVTDAAPSEIDLEITITVDGIDVSARADKIAGERKLAEQYAKTAQDDARSLARDLADRGIALRDIGEALGVSFQRAQQLIST